MIRRLVRDLDLPLEIRVVPTVRDDDGLALSSRNVHLSQEERERALGLPRALQAAAGSPDPVAAARASLNGLDPDYVEPCSTSTAPPSSPPPSASAPPA